MKAKSLVITGFHRSATSATANLLNTAGLHLGSELMPGNISNVNGHYEDLPIVRLHDSQLTSAGTSWQFHDEVKLNSNSLFLSEYIKKRSETEKYWGVKDPRACLFLNEWFKELGEQGSFLLITRHWSSCIESLLNRHSRDLAYSLDELGGSSSSIKFWSSPDIAARMWLSYSRRMLEFVQSRPNSVLLVTQRALFEGVPLISCLNEKFGFELDESVGGIYNDELINDSANHLIVKSLSQSLRLELNNTWQELLNLSDFKSIDEKPQYYSQRKLPHYFETDYNTCLRLEINRNRDESGHLSQGEDEFLDVPYGSSESKFFHWIKRLKSISFCRVKIDDVRDIVSNEYPSSCRVWLELGDLSHINHQYEDAIYEYHYAMLLGCAPPNVNIRIGQCYKALKKNALALFYFDRALLINPDNPSFYVVKSRLYLEGFNLEDAESCLLLGIERLGFVLPLALAYVNFLMVSNRSEEALSVIDCIDKPSLLAQKLKVQIKIQQDFRNGIIDYYEMIGKYIHGKDKMRWLVKITKGIFNSDFENDLIVRCYNHWLTLDDNVVNF